MPIKVIPISGSDSRFIRLTVLLVALLSIPNLRAQAPGTPDSLNARVESAIFESVIAMALQPDGKLIIGGKFTAVLGTARSNIARLNADGSLDSSFNPNANNWIFCAAVQTDGKILIGGEFTTLEPGSASAPVTRNRIARLHPDGSIDTSFNPNANDRVMCLAVQPDGRILAGGNFTRFRPEGAVSETVRNRIARLHSDGTVDQTFDPNAGNFGVRCIMPQSDGKILIGGDFTELSPNGAATAVTTGSLARVFADGRLDTGFDPQVTGSVYSTATEPDGSVLVAGWFGRVQPNGAAEPINRNYMARLYPDGSLDPDFNPNPNAPVYALALQADGRMVVAGRFTSLQPNGAPASARRNYIARINHDGSLDSAFDPDSDMPVFAAGLQPDGKILLGGDFSRLKPNGATAITVRTRLARLNNNVAGQSLTVPESGRILWRRSGTSPEIQQAEFAVTTDGGVSWTPLGEARRIGGTSDWELGNVDLPSAGQLRATGRLAAGYHAGSSGLLAATVPFPSALQVWTQSWFGITSSTGDAAATSDPNGNGLPNLLEYALGGDPLAHITGLSILPRVTVDGSTGRAELSFSRYPERKGISLIIQSSSGLTGGWEDAAYSSDGNPFVPGAAGFEVIELHAGDQKRVTFRDRLPAGDLSRFLRLKVTAP